MSYENFKTDTDANGIALITWDMPDRSMNVFTAEVMDEIDRIVDAVAADEAVKGAIITSGKRGSFTGGADLKMLSGMFERFEAKKRDNPDAAIEELFEAAGRMSWLWRKLETCGKPLVAAINGTCMGGGFELALACHGRVAAEDAKMGLPEVKVGIFPGAGGTQRVPRLTDTQSALQMLLKGSTLTAAKAKGMKLIDQVVPQDQLVDAAKAMLKAGLSPVKPWDEKGFKLPSGPVYSVQGAQVWPAVASLYRKETNDNYPGARAIVKCVYEGLLVPMDTALRIEQRYFTEVLQTTEAAMMIRSLFVSMQELNKGARRPKNVPVTELKKVGIVGAGFMGAGIAFVSAQAGLEVVLIDRDQAAADKGKAHSNTLLEKAVSQGRSTKEQAEAVLGRITATPDYDALKDADLVIEAVFEDRDVKAEVTKQVAAVLRKDAIYASNTSTIPITSLAEAFEDPARFIGVHFFSPVDRMMLTEVILGKQTGDKALAVALDFVRAIKKTPIVVNDTRGFFANRCVLRYMSEAYDMLVEGVPPAMIENAAKFAGMPVGPLALNDETAVDLSLKIMKATIRDMGEDSVDPRHFKLVEQMNADGRLGRKAGKGFYDYPAKPAKKALWPGLKQMFEQQPADSIDFEELKQRFLVTMALEAARTMEEGVVTDPREADVGSILGFGFAPYTGGTISYIDGMGTKAFVALCEKLAAKHGERFEPTPLLKDMAAKGETFYRRFAPGGSQARAA
ncbi:3-hydroxyacyl-CoA dehydrogenase NAD-binding domain-containing protein [Aurantimonas endophytica]|uniref:3-hydroxyacyl-CoA dehydrogenase/enoyl-CoA hydratase/3-hydroxybutyryl-CoA epimerase n=1 Tax=Aurantimonas endophytica TaxID=1522175 RepID=A0A7W6HGR3_9HYPH|nr:3-hydroxyacyl-CoA dehydrogenase NAD-binding domain-containing protein [Aurantimonas endophytica]MBB4004867.1 3-hydroxyacyl-CoA dehydrogenase/enoyl-CoA hydratase/3-hydroxybutyryl-CoA epimerase [Aurantimonas endophytica]MCO6405677.1 3-hydroxyacyl-CoA dehydrogenase [Aurantimonas endophytica]